MNTIRVRTTQISAGVIAVIAVGASYGGQVSLVESWGVQSPYSILIPLTVDLLAVSANVARHTPELDRSGRVAGTVVLGLAGSVSIAANLLHGANWGARIAYVWCVVAYLAAEYLVAKVTAASARKAVAEVRESRFAIQDAPLSPAAVPAPMIAEIEEAMAPTVALFPKANPRRMRQSSTLAGLNRDSA